MKRVCLLALLGGCALVDALGGDQSQTQPLPTCATDLVTQQFAVTNITWVVEVMGIGDFDGDGQKDLVVSGDGTNLTLLYGDAANGGLPTGHVTLGPMTDIGGGAPVDVVVADFDGDGRSDAAMLMTNPARVEIVFGAADRTLKPAIVYSVIPATAIAAGTLTSWTGAELPMEARLVVVGNAPSSTLRILTWKSDHFDGLSDEAGANPVSVAVGDADGNSQNDLALSHQDQVVFKTGPASSLERYLPTASPSPRVLFGIAHTFDAVKDVYTVQVVDGAQVIQIHLDTAIGESAMFQKIADVSIPTNVSSDRPLVRLGDLDGDGIDDVVLTGNDGIDGKGACSWRPTSARHPRVGSIARGASACSATSKVCRFTRSPSATSGRINGRRSCTRTR